MMILEENDLEQFVHELKEQWPQSLSIYNLARNHLLKNQFAWPGIEFVVDRFPNHTACLIRPVRNVETFPPRHVHGNHAPYASDPEALRKFLAEPEVMDWTRPIFFAAVSRNLMDVLFEACRKHGTYIGYEEREDFQGFAVVFRPEKLVPGPPLPEGFTLSSLRRPDIETINSIWVFGRTEATLQYMLYLYDNDFPTVGIYAPNGQLAAYVMTGSDMVMCAAYVFPEYRNKKFFHILAYHWCRKMFDLGVELPYAGVSEQNIRSRTALSRVGAERTDWDFTWTIFVPHGYSDHENVLLKWHAQRGATIWNQ